MPKPRKNQVSLDATPYYHCISRCVRRAYLCGDDKHTGKNYEHRKQWIEDRILQLGEIFAIDVCAYAVMSNHYHIVLHINAAKAHKWSNIEVTQRWHQLFKGTLLTHKFLKNETLNQAETDVIQEKIALWRTQLMDISWFMRALNEPIARESNREDKCTGRFWEGRFKSQALLDDAALAACMAYVDLNPIRAKIANTPETSENTSVKKRIDDLRTSKPNTLYPFVGNPREPMPEGLPFHLMDYLELVDWTGRIIREDKRGAIDNHLPPILDRLNIEPKHWLYLTRNFESRFKNLVGSAYSFQKHLQHFNRSRMTEVIQC